MVTREKLMAMHTALFLLFIVDIVIRKIFDALLYKAEVDGDYEETCRLKLAATTV